MVSQYSPLRYPGGKAKISPRLQTILRKNRLTSCRYLEPFAGGAGAALDLLLCEHVDTIHINDADRSIFSFWNAILESSDRFIEKLKTTDITVEEWYRQKAILKDNGSSVFELGFATFFLNRCNVSGVISGGIIGGKEQNGTWKIDARMNKDSLSDRIERISFYKDRISASNLDWHEFLDMSLADGKGENTFVYLDPPYYKKGQDLYMNYFVHDDHVKLEKYLRGKANWVLTYDFVPEILEIYKDYRTEEFVLNYSARNVRAAKEVMIFSGNLS